MRRKKLKLNVKEKALLRILTLVLVVIATPLIVLGFLKDKLLVVSLPEILQAQETSQASLTLNPESFDLAPNQEFTVNLLLDTKGKTVSAVDAQILFDPSLLEFVSGEKGAISKFPYYPVLGQVSSQGSTSLVTISAIDFDPNTGSFTKGYKTQGKPGLLASLNFRTKALPSDTSSATTVLNFKFTTSSTTDSNIIKKGVSEDILGEVNQTRVNIAASVPTPSPSPTPISTPTSRRTVSKKIEAESGVLRDSMKIASDSQASGGKYIYPEGKGFASYRVKLPKKANYYLWMRINTKNTRTNSFYIKFDNDRRRYTLRLPVTGGKWQWHRVKFRSIFLKRNKINLTKGNHEVKISKRKKNTKLDKFILTNDVGFKPRAL